MATPGSASRQTSAAHRQHTTKHNPRSASKTAKHARSKKSWTVVHGSIKSCGTLQAGTGGQLGGRKPRWMFRKGDQTKPQAGFGSAMIAVVRRARRVAIPVLAPVLDWAAAAVTGSMPQSLIAAAAAGEARKLMSALAASGSRAPATMPAEKIVNF